MLEDKRKYTKISERDFAQRLDFFREKRDVFIDVEIVVKIDDAKTRRLLIWAFFDDFARMLLFAIIVKFSLIANISNFWNTESFTLNDSHDDV